MADPVSTMKNALEGGNGNYSTFTIDTSKKCLIPGIDVRIGDDLIPASLFGDLDSTFLKDVRFNVKEELGSVFQKSLDTVESLTKPFREAINTVLGKFPGYDHVKGKTLGDTALYLYTAFSQMTQGTEKTAVTLNSLNPVALKNAPYRKSMPDLTFSGRKFTIDFAYGKCNLFNARYEVFEPLEALRKTLFPKIVQKRLTVDGKATDYEGLGEMVDTTIIPFEQQVELNTINAVTDIITSPLTSGAQSIKGLMSEFKSNTMALQNMMTNSDIATRVSSLKNKVYANKLETVKGDGGLLEKIGNAFKNALGGGPTQIKEPRNFKSNIDSIYDCMHSAYRLPDAKEEAIADTGEIPECIDAQLLAYKALEDLHQYAVSTNQVLPPASGLSFKSDGSLSGAVSLSKSPVDDNTKNQLFKVLHDVINLPYIIAGISNSKSSINNARRVYLGFKPLYVHNLKELVGECSRDKALVLLDNIYFTDYSIKFNYEDIDKEGYPMSGQLIITNIWNVSDPFHTLTLNAR